MRLMLLFCAVATVFCEKRNDFYDINKGPLVTHKVWFDVKIGNEDVGRIVIGLFGRTARDAVRNFVALAKPSPYVNHRGGSFYSIVKGKEVVGGNSDCDSDYGTYFPKGKMKLKHYDAGWVAMLEYNKENVHSCLFYIILKTLHEYDGETVVFGKVLDGMKFIWNMSNVEVDEKNHPKKDIIISECGTELADPPFRVARVAATY